VTALLEYIEVIVIFNVLGIVIAIFLHAGFIPRDPGEISSRCGLNLEA